MASVEILNQNGFDFLWIGSKGEDKYLWMWDIPVERKAQEQLAQKSYGKVLVAGYGLGVVQECLSQNPEVERVITVEIMPEVIRANVEAGRELQGEIVFSDFFDFESRVLFDTVIGDIWKDITPEVEDVEMYERYKNKAFSLLKDGGQMLGWGMDYFDYVLERHPTRQDLHRVVKT